MKRNTVTLAPVTQEIAVSIHNKLDESEKGNAMPSCFQLKRDGAAVPLNQIDEEMCRYFNAECHPTRYFEGWYDSIGFFLATGKTFDQIRVIYADVPILVEIADWLEANFAPDQWHELKSHPRD